MGKCCSTNTNNNNNSKSNDLNKNKLQNIQKFERKIISQNQNLKQNNQNEVDSLKVNKPVFNLQTNDINQLQKTEEENEVDKHINDMKNFIFKSSPQINIHDNAEITDNNKSKNIKTNDKYNLNIKERTYSLCFPVRKFYVLSSITNIDYSYKRLSNSFDINNRNLVKRIFNNNEESEFIFNKELNKNKHSLDYSSSSEVVSLDTVIGQNLTIKSPYKIVNTIKENKPNLKNQKDSKYDKYLKPELNHNSKKSDSSIVLTQKCDKDDQQDVKERHSKNKSDSLDILNTSEIVYQNNFDDTNFQVITNEMNTLREEIIIPKENEEINLITKKQDIVETDEAVKINIETIYDANNEDEKMQKPCSLYYNTKEDNNNIKSNIYKKDDIANTQINKFLPNEKELITHKPDTNRISLNLRKENTNQSRNTNANFQFPESINSKEFSSNWTNFITQRTPLNIEDGYNNLNFNFIQKDDIIKFNQGISDQNVRNSNKMEISPKKVKIGSISNLIEKEELIATEDTVEINCVQLNFVDDLSYNLNKKMGNKDSVYFKNELEIKNIQDDNAQSSKLNHLCGILNNLKVSTSRNKNMEAKLKDKEVDFNKNIFTTNKEIGLEEKTLSNYFQNSNNIVNRSIFRSKESIENFNRNNSNNINNYNNNNNSTLNNKQEVKINHYDMNNYNNEENYYKLNNSNDKLYLKEENELNKIIEIIKNTKIVNPYNSCKDCIYSQESLVIICGKCNLNYLIISCIIKLKQFYNCDLINYLLNSSKSNVDADYKKLLNYISLKSNDIYFFKNIKLESYTNYSVKENKTNNNKLDSNTSTVKYITINNVNAIIKEIGYDNIDNNSSILNSLVPVNYLVEKINKKDFMELTVEDLISQDKSNNCSIIASILSILNYEYNTILKYLMNIENNLVSYNEIFEEKLLSSYLFNSMKSNKNLKNAKFQIYLNQSWWCVDFPSFNKQINNEGLNFVKITEHIVNLLYVNDNEMNTSTIYKPFIYSNPTIETHHLLGWIPEIIDVEMLLNAISSEISYENKERLLVLEEIWNIFSSNFNENLLICLGTDMSLTNKNVKNYVPLTVSNKNSMKNNNLPNQVYINKHNGLIMNHCYTVSNLRKQAKKESQTVDNDDEVYYFDIINPLKQLSNNSSISINNSTTSINNYANDRKFSMTFEEVINNFAYIYLSWNPQLFMYNFKDTQQFFPDNLLNSNLNSLVSDSVINSLEYNEDYSVYHLPQYLLTIPPHEDDLDLRLVLTRNIKYITSINEYPKGNLIGNSTQNIERPKIAFKVFYYTNNRIIYPVDECKSSSVSREICSEVINIKPNQEEEKLVIVILQVNYLKSKEFNDFTINLYSHYQLDIKLIPKSTEALLFSESSTWTGKNGEKIFKKPNENFLAGGIKSEHFLNNPFYEIEIPNIKNCDKSDIKINFNDTFSNDDDSNYISISIVCETVVNANIMLFIVPKSKYNNTTTNPHISNKNSNKNNSNTVNIENLSTAEANLKDFHYGKIINSFEELNNIDLTQSYHNSFYFSQFACLKCSLLPGSYYLFAVSEREMLILNFKLKINYINEKKSNNEKALFSLIKNMFSCKRILEFNYNKSSILRGDWNSTNSLYYDSLIPIYDNEEVDYSLLFLNPCYTVRFNKRTLAKLHFKLDSSFKSHDDEHSNLTNSLGVLVFKDITEPIVKSFGSEIESKIKSKSSRFKLIYSSSERIHLNHNTKLSNVHSVQSNGKSIINNELRRFLFTMSSSAWGVVLDQIEFEEQQDYYIVLLNNKLDKKKSIKYELTLSSIIKPDIFSKSTDYLFDFNRSFNIYGKWDYMNNSTFRNYLSSFKSLKTKPNNSNEINDEENKKIESMRFLCSPAYVIQSKYDYMYFNRLSSENNNINSLNNQYTSISPLKIYFYVVLNSEEIIPAKTNNIYSENTKLNKVKIEVYSLKSLSEPYKEKNSSSTINNNKSNQGNDILIPDECIWSTSVEFKNHESVNFDFDIHAIQGKRVVLYLIAENFDYGTMDIFVSNSKSLNLGEYYFPFYAYNIGLNNSPNRNLSDSISNNCSILVNTIKTDFDNF